ncbi:MAG: hypothetical protein M1820_010222 [Bogoriella megaspora]|nr:MAG: hypothetical protein M1820_010222 [Bogoriella megaspora]
MIQGGDITKGDGTGGESIYGGEFEDENLSWRDIDAEGLLCMANRGKGTNSSQFFITLVPCPHLNGKHTVFGYLVSGEEVIKQMASVQVDDDDRPVTPLLIAHCGELERRKKLPERQESSRNIASAIEDNDRGRRKRRRTTSRSPSPDDEISRKPHHKRDRRRSDLEMDSTLRGRATRRGGSESISPFPEDGNEKRRRKHRRPHHRRSQSPSRGAAQTHTEDDVYERRRQRSLPNQYREEDRQLEDRRDRGDSRRDGGYRERRGGYDSWRGRDLDRRDKWRDRGQDEGRLGGTGDEAVSEGGIRFKGRGTMKYRENW